MKSKYPKYLNDYGQKCWDEYLSNIKNQTDHALKVVADLCYWEQVKDEAQRDLEENEMAVCVYYNEDGSIKHTQASAYFTVLKDSQVKVDNLREVVKQFYSNVDESKERMKMRAVKNF